MVCPVVDLHCDLLAYLNANRESHGPMDEASRCSLPLLKKGGVFFQVLALFSETGKGSRKECEGQIECFRGLKQKEALHFGLAVENASGLLEEDEPLESLFSRFDAEKWVYIGLTWKAENRFGGGDTTQVGLKRDGELLLDYMDRKGVAIDLSHTSDPLAEGILDYIDKKGLRILPIASHSNFREVKGVARNLPDPVAKEVIARGGVIGINFVRRFVGDAPEDFLRHVDHALALGGEETLVLGADFFGGLSLASLSCLEPLFQKTFSDSGCYPTFFSLLAHRYGQELTEKIFYKNAMRVFPQIPG